VASSITSSLDWMPNRILRRARPIRGGSIRSGQPTPVGGGGSAGGGDTAGGTAGASTAEAAAVCVLMTTFNRTL